MFFFILFFGFFFDGILEGKYVKDVDGSSLIEDVFWDFRDFDRFF